MSKKYVCLSCYEIYNEDYLKIDEWLDEQICPKTDCSGHIIEVDDLLIPTIITLNKKGYYTKFCCSGHYDSQHPEGYIYFEEGIKLPNVPNGFYLEEEDGKGVTIRSNICKNRRLRKPTHNDFYKICDNAKSLLKWANQLPYYEE